MRKSVGFLSVVKISILTVVSFFLVLLSLIGVFSPIYSLTDELTRNIRADIKSGVDNFNQTVGVFGNVYSIKKERDDLLIKVGLLEEENTRLKIYGERIKVLEDQLGTTFSQDFELVAGEIIFLDPKEEGRARINRGLSDGVSEGDILVLNNSALGEVVKANNYTSDILLITSPEASISVISQTNQTRGIMTGEFGGRVVVNNILQTDKLENGESFITLGTNSKYPSGLFVGRVSEIREVQAETKKTAVLENAIDFRELRYVFVLRIKKDQ
ncbi:rod shape-determining protein MreC [Candidatus Dojkabacteria bacterium]|nr:rod shape-determining protein MreC [Candidatus Dojkabacteria bacterium]